MRIVQPLEDSDRHNAEPTQFSVAHLEEMVEAALNDTRSAIYVTTQKDPENGGIILQKHGLAVEAIDYAVDNLLTEFTELGLEAVRKQLKQKLDRALNECNHPPKQKKILEKRTWQQRGRDIVWGICHPALAWKCRQERKCIEKEDREELLRECIRKAAHLDLLEGLLIMAIAKARLLRQEVVQNQD